MNGFERHASAFQSKANPNVHLSASTFALIVNAPDVFVAEKLYGKRGPMGPAPMRGIVIEDAVSSVLQGGSHEDALEKALETFDRRMLFGDEATAKERAMIEPSIELTLEALKPYGEPEFAEDGKQQAISLKCRTDDWTIPFVGYLDFVFPKHGLIIDLKTTGRMPGVMSRTHQVQRAIYERSSGNMACKFLYVTPKKFEFKEDGDVKETLEYVKTMTIRAEAFLNQGDREHLRQIVPVNPESFYWRGNEDARRELYGV